MFSQETISRVNKAENRRKGQLGEEIAVKFLLKNGFRVVTRNYRKKWGEIDIIAAKNNETHFFEVKSVTTAVGARPKSAHRPEENVDAFKSRQIRRMIQTYFAEQGGGPEAEFHFHVLVVSMDMSLRKARVKWIKDVIL